MSRGANGSLEAAKVPKLARKLPSVEYCLTVVPASGFDR
jgi:hypothetical protein